MITLTIFTPTYNRADLLPKVYQSLLDQEDKDFEWIIVDDGSEDHTEEYIRSCIAEGILSIKYFKQTNAGKHVAINYGLSKASGTLFLILDSDDELTQDAVQIIKHRWQHLSNTAHIAEFAGIVGNKMFADGRPVGTELHYDLLDTTIIDYRFKKKIKGDKLEIFRTELLQQYLFPENGEKFCPEALIWNRIGSVFLLRFFNQAIYKCEYLPDGLTHQIVQIRRKSPKNTSLYYAELTHYNIPALQKLKAAINYWRFCMYDHSSTWANKWHQINPQWSLLGLPLGWVMRLWDKRKQ